ncbi:MAG: hypothetical protein H0W81_04895 [Chloroflexi bacterium]|nr:hypothetical protein [Chloroflexota bacterium]
MRSPPRQDQLAGHCRLVDGIEHLFLNGEAGPAPVRGAAYNLAELIPPHGNKEACGACQAYFYEFYLPQIG